MSDRPYAPSWLDRLTDAVARVPGPYWLVYLLVGGGFSLGRAIIGWIDGSYPVGTFFGIHVIDGLIPLYFLFAIHLLDDLAVRSIADFQPRLRGGATEFEELRYRLTTMPFGVSLVLGILGLALGAVYIQLFLSAVDVAASRYLTSSASVVMDTVLSALSGLMMVTFGYHSIRQLWMISRIYTRHTNVGIFDIGGLYALSRVTAVTTVALLFFTYVYLSVYTSGQINSVSNGVLVVLIIFIAVLAFILPLYGAHRLLQRAKNDRMSEIARRIEAASDALHAKTDARAYTAEVDHIKNVLDGLLVERSVVAKASTWPWEPDAVRGVLTVVLLPILIGIVSRILGRFGI